MTARGRVLLFAAVALSVAAPAWAGGAINNQNLSADYIRMLNRNAATDAADIVFFNPAGITKLDDGFTIRVDAQYVIKDYGNVVDPFDPIETYPGGGGEFDQDEPSIIPGIFAAYNGGSWAAFFGVANVAGGGKVDYADGNWTSYQASLGALSAMASLPASLGGPITFEQITSHSLEAESTAPEIRAGMAWQGSEALSLSAGVRYIDFSREANGVGTLQDLDGSVGGASTDLAIGFEEEGTGIGWFLSAHVTPGDRWNFGVRYESEVDLELDQTVTESSISLNPALSPITDGILAAAGVVDGGTVQENLPALLGVGVGFKLTDNVRLEFDYNWYMDESADLERARYADIQDSQEYGLALDWQVTDSLKLSAGYLATRLDLPTEDLLPERPELDADSYAAGLLWSLTDHFDLTLGVSKNTYDSQTFEDDLPPAGTGATVTFEKDGWGAAAGVQFTF